MLLLPQSYNYFTSQDFLTFVSAVFARICRRRKSPQYLLVSKLSGLLFMSLLLCVWFVCMCLLVDCVDLLFFFGEDASLRNSQINFSNNCVRKTVTLLAREIPYLRIILSVSNGLVLLMRTAPCAQDMCIYIYIYTHIYCYCVYIYIYILYIRIHIYIYIYGRTCRTWYAVPPTSALSALRSIRKARIHNLRIRIVASGLLGNIS